MKKLRQILKDFLVKRRLLTSELSQDDLREVLEAGSRSGVLDKTEPELIKSIFEFTDSRDTAIGPLCMDALGKAKLRADRDFGSVYEGKFIDVLAKELRSGSRDAICISPIAWKSLNQEAPGAFRVLKETDRIPVFALSINTNLDEQDKKKLTAALTGIGGNAEGKAALAAITGSASGATETPAATSAEYVAAGQLLSQGKQLYDRQIPR